MAAVLAVYLRDCARRPWRWDGGECLTFVADWIVRARGRDPAAPWRGQVIDADSARALLRQRGGIRKHASASLAAIGLRPTKHPRAGDVGLVRAPVVGRRGPVRRLTGAICVGRAWALLTPDAGLVIAAPPAIEPVLAWSVSDA